MRISAQIIDVLVDALRLQGVDATPWLKLPKPLSRGSDGDGWHPVAEYDRVVELALQLTGDPGFGLVVAVSLAQARQGEIVAVMMNAPTLRVTLQDMLRYGQLLQEPRELSLELRGAHAVLCLQPLGASAAVRRFRAEQAMGGLAMMLRFNQVGLDDLRWVNFAYPRPAYATRYAGIFGPQVRFGQPACEIAIDARWLDVQQPGRDAAAHAQARLRAEAALSALSALSAEAPFVADVRRCLRERDGEVPDMATVAARLGISARTLRRRLVDSGVAYAELLNEHRRAQAERLLAAAHLPLKEVAAQLGYSSVSSFHRAFRRSTGQTPTDWRAHAGAPPATDD